MAGETFALHDLFGAFAVVGPRAEAHAQQQQRGSEGDW
jgi:hypothetical protein